MVLLCFWIMWRIWKSRNNLIFKKHISKPEKDVTLSVAEVKEWLLAISQGRYANRSITVSQNHNTTQCATWTRPPIGFVNCNFEAAYDPVSRQVKGGWIVRDHFGFAKYWDVHN